MFKFNTLLFTLKICVKTMLSLFIKTLFVRGNEYSYSLCSYLLRSWQEND